MATRSTISVKVNENEIRSIYSHWDGYPSHHYPLLVENYSTQEQAEGLVELGAIYSLDASNELVEGHSFENPKEGHTVYYGRDRNEEIEFQTFELFEQVDNLQEYHYYWNGSEWEVFEIIKGDNSINITDDIKNKYRNGTLND